MSKQLKPFYNPPRVPSDSFFGRKLIQAKGSIMAGKSHENTTEQALWNQAMEAQKKKKKEDNLLKRL